MNSVAINSPLPFNSWHRRELYIVKQEGFENEGGVHVGVDLLMSLVGGANSTRESGQVKSRRNLIGGGVRIVQVRNIIHLTAHRLIECVDEHVKDLMLPFARGG